MVFLGFVFFLSVFATELELELERIAFFPFPGIKMCSPLYFGCFSFFSVCLMLSLWRIRASGLYIGSAVRCTIFSMDDLGLGD